MHRKQPTGNVRRRLFPDDDVTTQAKIDNTTNYLTESIERDIKEKIQKWNFDFENDVPLEGIYEWTPCTDESRNWVGVKKIENSKEKIVAAADSSGASDYEIESDKIVIDTNNETINDVTIAAGTGDEMEKQSTLSIKEINEITPRNYRVEDVPVRKRKSEIIDGMDLDKGVRRKISFD